MCIGKNYIAIELDIYQLKCQKQEIDKLIKKQELQKTELKNKMVNEYLESGVCYDDLGLHVKKVPPKVIIQDPEKIPEKFMRVKKEIDKTKINASYKLGESVEGTTIDNGGYTIMFKAKG